MASWSIVILVLSVLLIWFIVIYNRLTRLRNLKRNSWSDIDVQLKKRHNLVPNLVRLVKAYAKHEREAFEAIVEARNRAQEAKKVEESVEAETRLNAQFNRLLVLVEAYPELKADRSFRTLHEELVAIENDLASARRYYNAVVRDYRNAQEIFPNALVSGFVAHEPAPFFEVEPIENIAPEVTV